MNILAKCKNYSSHELPAKISVIYTFFLVSLLFLSMRLTSCFKATALQHA